MLLLFMIALVAVTSNAVGFDAHRMQIPIGNGPYSGARHAVLWAVGCAVLWIIAFPLYLYRRAKTLRERGGENDTTLVTRVGAITIVLALLIIVTSTLGWERMSIEDLTAEVRFEIEKDWRRNVATRRNRLASLHLTRVGRNDYAGAVVATLGNGKTEAFNLAVFYDGHQVTWKAIR